MYSEIIMYEEAELLATSLRNTLVRTGAWKLNNNALTSIPVMAIFLKYCNDNQKSLQIDMPEILQFVVLNKILPEYLPEEQLRSFFDRMQKMAGIDPESGNIFSHVFQDNKKEECALCLKEMLCVAEDWDLNEEKNGPVAACAAIHFLSIVGRTSYRESKGLPIEIVRLIHYITPKWTSMKCYSNSQSAAAQLPYITATTEYSLSGFVDQFGITDAEAIALLMSRYASKIRMFGGLFDWLPEGLKGEEGTFDFVLMLPEVRRFFDSQTVVKAVEDGNESLVAWWPEEPGCKEWLYARNMINLLSDRGTGCIIYPLGSLAKIGSQAEIRKKIMEEHYLKAVIELPSGTMPQTGTKFAILVLEKGADNSGIFMVNLDSEQGKELVSIKRGEIMKFNVDKIGKIVNEREPVGSIARQVSFDEIKKANYCLSPSAYIFDSRNKQLEVDLAEEYETQIFNHEAFMKDTVKWDADIAEYMIYRKMKNGVRKEDKNGGTTHIQA
ncbi:MAG: SAM-dependent methyltransferase [Oscillospiraceae bacterium]|nr:SAM-dependent methyltransferase [Oscillospiraceae bacterium]